jgi:hypothetical protein
MRILITIPHYFAPGTSPKHGSTRLAAETRTKSLSACLTALYTHYGSQQYQLQIADRKLILVNQAANTTVDVIICTTGNFHLLEYLPPGLRLFKHQNTNADPLFLGFECHTVLRENLGNYDFYGYLEDDLIMQDGWFFQKLDWFTQLAGSNNLLQPNRFEIGDDPPVKLYIDGDLRPDITSPYQNRQEHSELHGTYLGQNICFQRPLNPHAGCFFLNQAQLFYWTQQAQFWDRKTSFVGPLESAATLSVLQTFRIYKPARDYANFFEIQHAGKGFVITAGLNKSSTHPNT